MDLQLTGKSALVSGSTGGIGYAVADALAAEGMRVIVNGRSAPRVDQAVARLRAAHPDVEVSGIVADFAEAIRTGRNPLVDGSEGRRSVALITALYESSRKGSQPVKIRPYLMDQI